MKIGCLPPGARAAVYTLSGEKTADLLASGDWIEWDGRNEKGRKVSEGAYYLLVTVGGQTVVRQKLIVLRSR